MINHEVLFAGKKFLVSDQLPMYDYELSFCGSYIKELMGVLQNQIDNKSFSSGAEEDFIKWRKPCENIAKKMIERASQKGVYDLTIPQLTDENPAFKKLYNICCESMDDMRNILMNSIADYARGFDEAVYSAAENIKGPGFGILTNSFASVMLYKAISHGAVQSQIKQAERDYTASIDKLNAENTDQMNAAMNKARIKYYSNANAVIPLIITNMMDIFFMSLQSHGEIDLNEIKSSYDIESSNGILRNIDYLDNKTEVLYSAFEACPYNVDVFKAAMSLGVFDKETYDTARYLNLHSDIAPLIRDKCKVGRATREEISQIPMYLDMLSDISNEDTSIFAKQEYYTRVSNIVTQYKKMKIALGNKRELKNWVNVKITNDMDNFCNTDDGFISEKIKYELTHITLEEEMSLYRQYGLINIEDITIDGSSGFKDLASLNDAYIKELCTAVINLRNDISERRDKYLDAYNQYMDEKTALENKKTSLINERNALPFFSFSKKGSYDKEIVAIGKELEGLVLKYNLNQLKRAYTEEI